MLSSIFTCMSHECQNKKFNKNCLAAQLSLFVQPQAPDLSKPIDKRIYKGTQPTCHDFNPLTATAESVSLLVGFSAGQVQLIDPIKKETSKLFNEEVSPIQWIVVFKSIFLFRFFSVLYCIVFYICILLLTVPTRLWILAETCNLGSLFRLTSLGISSFDMILLVRAAYVVIYMWSCTLTWCCRCSFEMKKLFPFPLCTSRSSFQRPS